MCSKLKALYLLFYNSKHCVVRDAINIELLQIENARDNSHLKCLAPSENS